MKKIAILLFVITFSISCNKSSGDIRKMSKEDQTEYLNQEYQLDLTALNGLSDEQFAELLELHLKGVFDSKSLNVAWKEFANLDNEESEKYIHDNFQDYKNMGVILSVYGPRFYNK